MWMYINSKYVAFGRLVVSCVACFLSLILNHIKNVSEFELNRLMENGYSHECEKSQFV